MGYFENYINQRIVDDIPTDKIKTSSLFGDFDYTNIAILHKMLNDTNIPHLLIDRNDETDDGTYTNTGYQILYPNEVNRVCSVIQGSFSYGGREGLLEIMGLLTEDEEELDNVVGYLTTIEVFNRIKKDFDKNGGM